MTDAKQLMRTADTRKWLVNRGSVESSNARLQFSHIVLDLPVCEGFTEFSLPCLFVPVEFKFILQPAWLIYEWRTTIFL